MSDTLKITILADGTIRTETDQISQANHDSAEEFLRQVRTLTGGESHREMRPNVFVDQHVHTHDKETT